MSGKTAHQAKNEYQVNASNTRLSDWWQHNKRRGFVFKLLLSAFFRNLLQKVTTGCYIQISAGFNLNCDWFNQIMLSMHRKLRT